MINWTRKNTCDDHLQSKSNRERQPSSKNSSLQQTLTSAATSTGARQEFVEDFVAVCAESDIPLEKIQKLRPFLVKHCKQGGALPERESSPRQTHLPCVFEQHMEAVLQKIRGKKLSAKQLTQEIAVS